MLSRRKFIIKKAIRLILICVNVQGFVAHIVSQMPNNKTGKAGFIWIKPTLLISFLLYHAENMENIYE